MEGANSSSQRDHVGDQGSNGGGNGKKMPKIANHLGTRSGRRIRKFGKGIYIEWELYPQKVELAIALLKQSEFSLPPEFQFAPLPQRNPVLFGERWKQYHEALGPSTACIPDFSWEMVKKEKAPDMRHLLQFPCNGEAPFDKLMMSDVTPNEYHFIRNHGGVPECIDEENCTFEVGGTWKGIEVDHVGRTQERGAVSPTRSGTRRIEQIQEYPGDGDELINAPWGEGAIGTAVYRGVSLKNVLLNACRGFDIDSKNAHCEFIGADTYFKEGKPYNYAVSIPYRKVKDDETLLAWEMNGKPLPLIHGYPLRVVVPGYIGARSCKWLKRINVLDEASRGPVQRKEYLYYNAQVGKHNSLYSNGFSIQDMPVSSAIMKPRQMDKIIHSGTIHIEGWAYSGGGRWVERVEVSVDGGHIWYQVDPADLSPKHYHTWRLWKIDLPVNAEGWLEVVCRTWDNACNTQPTFVRSAWNWDLHVTSSCHHVKSYSINTSHARTAARLAAYAERGLDFAAEPSTRPVPFDLEEEEDYDKFMKMHPREPRN